MGEPSVLFKMIVRPCKLMPDTHDNFQSANFSSGYLGRLASVTLFAFVTEIKDLFDV